MVFCLVAKNDLPMLRLAPGATVSFPYCHSTFYILHSTFYTDLHPHELGVARRCLRLEVVVHSLVCKLTALICMTFWQYRLVFRFAALCDGDHAHDEDNRGIC